MKPPEDDRRRTKASSSSSSSSCDDVSSSRVRLTDGSGTTAAIHQKTSGITAADQLNVSDRHSAGHQRLQSHDSGIRFRQSRRRSNPGISELQKNR